MARGKQNKATKDAIVRVPFRFVQLSSTTVQSNTTWAEVDLVPSAMGPRLSDLAADFQRYRFTKLRCTIFAGVYAGGDVIATSYQQCVQGIAFDNSPSALTGAISSFASAASLMKYAAGRGDRVGFNVTRQELLGENSVKWWDTAATGAPADSFRYQGAIYYVTYTAAAQAALQPIHLQIEGECEFAGPVDPADVSPEVLRARVKRDLKYLEAAEEKNEDSDLISVPSVQGDPPRAGPRRDIPARKRWADLLE